jgi:hypothetical protein
VLPWLGLTGGISSAPPASFASPSSSEMHGKIDEEMSVMYIPNKSTTNMELNTDIGCIGLLLLRELSFSILSVQFLICSIFNYDFWPINVSPRSNKEYRSKH